MNNMCFRTFLLLCPAALLLAQTPPAAAPSAPPLPASGMTSRDNAPALPVVAPDKVILTIGDIKLTAAEFNQIIDSLPPQIQANARGAGRKQYAENIAKVLVLAEEAKRRKIDQSAAFKTQAMFQSANLLAQRAFDQINQESAPTEAELRKYYDDHIAEFEQVKARHILVRMQGSPVPVRPGQKELTEAEALAKATEIRKKIAAGEDFAALAKQESDDVSSGANGGSLGAFRKRQMVPAFEEAAFKLKPGEVSEPVKTQFGYHLIRADEHQNFAFDAAKSEIERRLKPDMAKKVVADLETKGNIVYDPDFFNLPKQ